MSQKNSFQQQDSIQQQEGLLYLLNCQFTSSEKEIDENYQELCDLIDSLQKKNKDQKIQQRILNQKQQIDNAYKLLRNKQTYDEYVHKLKIRSYLNQKIQDFQQNETAQDENEDKRYSSQALSNSFQNLSGANNFTTINNNNNNNANNIQHYNQNSQQQQQQQANFSLNYSNNMLPVGNIISQIKENNNNNSNNNSNIFFTSSNIQTANNFGNYNTPSNYASNQNNSNQMASQENCIKKLFPFLLFVTFKDNNKQSTIIHFDFILCQITEESAGKITKKYYFNQIYGKVYQNREDEFTLNLKENNKVNTYTYKTLFIIQTSYIIYLFELASEYCNINKPLLKFINMKIDTLDFYSQEEGKSPKDNFFQDDRIVPINWLRKQKCAVSQFLCKKKTVYLFLGYTHLIESTDPECHHILLVIPLKPQIFTFHQQKNQITLQIQDNRKVFFFSSKEIAKEMGQLLTKALNSQKKMTYKQVQVSKNIFSEYNQKRLNQKIEKLQQKVKQLQENIALQKAEIQELQEEGNEDDNILKFPSYNSPLIKQNHVFIQAIIGQQGQNNSIIKRSDIYHPNQQSPIEIGNGESASNFIPNNILGQDQVVQQGNFNNYNQKMQKDSFVKEYSSKKKGPAAFYDKNENMNDCNNTDLELKSNDQVYEAFNQEPLLHIKDNESNNLKNNNNVSIDSYSTNKKVGYKNGENGSQRYNGHQQYNYANNGVKLKQE